MDFYGTVVAKGEDAREGSTVVWQDIRVDDTRFLLIDATTRIWHAIGALCAEDADIGDRVVIKWFDYPRIRWGAWKAKKIGGTAPPANKDRKLQ